MTQPRLERELSDGSRHVVELAVPQLRVGRREDSDLVIAHSSVSRQETDMTSWISKTRTARSSTISP